MSASKRKGSAWETECVRYMRDSGWPWVERMPPNGALDRGDIAFPGVTIEAKNQAKVELAGFLDEAEREAANAGNDLGVAWIKRRGKASAAAGYVVMSGESFVQLLGAAGYR